MSQDGARSAAGATVELPTPHFCTLSDAPVILLLIATARSAGLWLYERDEAIAICAVVLLNAVMGYVQESRADSAVAALRQMTAAHAHVIRDGESRTVPATDRGRRGHHRRTRRVDHVVRHTGQRRCRFALRRSSW